MTSSRKTRESLKPAARLGWLLATPLAVACATRPTAEVASPDSTEEETETEVVENEGADAPEVAIDEVPEPDVAVPARKALRAAAPPSNHLGLTFVVSQSGADLPWTMVVANTSESPVRMAADPRLLRLEITRPPAPEPEKKKRWGKKETNETVCELPKGERPSKVDRETVVELAPGEMAVQSFDPRLYCDGEAFLVPGATVTPHFGWPVETKTVWRGGKRQEEPIEQKEPFVAATVAVQGESTPEPLKELSGETLTLDDSYAPPAPPPPAPTPSTKASQLDPERPPDPIEVFIEPPGTTSDDRGGIITVKVKNPAKEGQRVFVRREFITFEVIGPEGATSCNAYPDARSPDKQEFSYIPAGSSLSLPTRLAEFCPPGTFDTSGLYRIHARLDAFEDGEEAGTEAFTGSVTTKEPALLRVKGGKTPQMFILPTVPAPEPSARAE